jgi:hypothetical protein
MDDSTAVRKAIIARSDINPWILEIIFRSSMEYDAADGFCMDEQVVLEIVRHLQTPLSILEDVAVRHLIHDQTGPQLSAIISHQNVTDRLLRKIASSPNRYIRLDVAKHAKNLWVLQDLESDKDEEVRKTATERLREQQTLMNDNN